LSHISEKPVGRNEARIGSRLQAVNTVRVRRGAAVDPDPKNNFPPDQWQGAYAAIEKFLAANVPAAKPPSTAGRP